MKIKFEGSLNEFRSLFHGAFITPLKETLKEPSPYDVSSRVMEAQVTAAQAKGEMTYDPDSHQPEMTYDPAPERVLSPAEALRAEMLAQLPKLTSENRQKGWEAFVDVCRQWAQGFDQPGPQPDRLELLRSLGSGSATVPVLVMAYECGSLQRLVQGALMNADPQLHESFTNEAAWLDYVGKIAGNMVQISHMAFPDIEGTYDHTNKWREQ